jgi:hypothetical protein
MKSVPNSELRFCQAAKQATAGFCRECQNSGAALANLNLVESEFDPGQIAPCSYASKAHHQAESFCQEFSSYNGSAET